MKNFFMLLLLALPLGSCASLLGIDLGADNSKQSESTAPVNAQPASVQEEVERPVTMNEVQGLELKQARLWARVDELEDLIRKQKAKIKVLEKGLLLGVVPQEFEESDSEENKVVSKEITQLPMKVMAESVKVMDVTGESAGKNSKGLSEDSEGFQKSMVEARDLFRSGRYGKAYLAFSKIDKEFSSSIATGEQKYWLGRCWHKLKEYQSARQYLQSYIGSYPNSPWTVSAKFYLAKVEMDLGLKEAAIRHFQQIIRDHPYEGTAEAAKQILGNMQKAL